MPTINLLYNMSKPTSQKNNRGLDYEPQTELMPLGKIKTEWDLKNLYYKSEKDPRLEADIVKAEKAYRKFINKWKKRDFTASAKVLCEALTEKEALAGMPEGGRAGRYFSFRTALNAKDDVADKQLALLSRRFRKLSDDLLFFGLTLGHIPKAKQKEFLKAKELEHFRYYLENVFKNATYDLTEDQEKIINLKSSQSYGRWVDMTQKIISNRTVNWQEKNIPVPEALETINTLPNRQKPKLWALVMAEMEQISEVAEHEYNAIITDVRTEDELRGYKKPYSATVLSYQDDEKSIENLVKTVTEEGFKLSKKFYKLKAKLHGVDKISYANKYDSIGKEPVIPFSEAVEICRDVFYELKPVYGEIFDNMLLNGQIDVYPRKGKRGGAFMSDATGHPTHVFLNHMDDFKSLETLAHEMGHAIHAERTKQYNTPFYEHFSTTTTETISTLFENFVFDAVYKRVPEKQKAVLLHDRLTRDISTIQRQIAAFNTELEIHNTINVKGAMTKEELRQCMEKHLKSYLGPAVDIKPEDGYSYVYWPHLRYGFYVYTYSFGLLMSTIMSKRYQADKSYIEKIDDFLCAGESASVADIFKLAKIDTRKPEVFREALRTQAKDIDDFAKYVRRHAK